MQLVIVIVVLKKLLPFHKVPDLNFVLKLLFQKFSKLRVSSDPTVSEEIVKV